MAKIVTAIHNQFPQNNLWTVTILWPMASLRAFFRKQDKQFHTKQRVAWGDVCTLNALVGAPLLSFLSRRNLGSHWLHGSRWPAQLLKSAPLKICLAFRWNSTVCPADIENQSAQRRLDHRKFVTLPTWYTAHRHLVPEGTLGRALRQQKSKRIETNAQDVMFRLFSYFLYSLSTFSELYQGWRSKSCLLSLGFMGWC